MDKFQLVSDYKLSGDQPEAVDALVKGIESGMREQTLMGVTGSGKTFTMANVIARINRPTLHDNCFSTYLHLYHIPYISSSIFMPVFVLNTLSRKLFMLSFERLSSKAFTRKSASRSICQSSPWTPS